MVYSNWKISSVWTKLLIPVCSYFLYSLLLMTVEGEKRYFLDCSVSLEPDHTIAHYAPLSDTLASDTLYEVRARSGIPVYYFRKISTNVCFDNKCRFLRTNVYWNITGRYLGLEFSEDEFLSKTDHVPFTESEYQEMNQKLADSLSLLAGYGFEDVVVVDSVQNTDVDGVTSATLPAIKDYVVDGAVYTTLKLWHIIHGPTRRMVENMTAGNLSEEGVLTLLGSQNSYDVVWVIRAIDGRENWPETVQAAIAAKLGENYLFTNTILQSIDASHLDTSFQNHLLRIFYASDYGTKELVVDKLSEADWLNENTAFGLVKEMPHLQGNLFVKILDLIGQEDWQDVELYRSVAGLLTLSNDFLTRKVYSFLQSRNISDSIVLHAMEQYAN